MSAGRRRPRRKKPVCDWRREDPYYERERARYGNPLPSREYILSCLKAAGAPMHLSEIAARMGITDAQEIDGLARRLRAMERQGQLVRNRREGYAPVDKLDLVRGTVVGHPEGYGFLVPDENHAEGDLYLSPREMRMLFPGDRVLARVTGVDRRGRREGTVVEVLERNTHHVVGRFFSENGVNFVVPDNRRITHQIHVPPGACGGARPGQIVTVEITEPPTRWKPPMGQITEVLGDHMAPGMEIDIAIRAHDLPAVWPAAVEEEIAGLVEEVAEEDKAGREDLRHLPLVTIDGADSRDFDDAVFCKRTPRGWRLYVAIADVSHYVRPGTALDIEAENRGNSVYFPERVLPMLPEILSNGLCSLNPHVDRLCMVCELLIDRQGEIQRSRFFEGVMRSHARLTYDEVAAMLLDRDPAVREQYRDLLPHLEELHRLYQALRGARERRGAIDFETEETKIVFGEDRKIERIVPVERNDAHRIIEECMIAANVAAARFLQRHRVPTLFRVHEGPQAEKLEDLRTFLRELGLSLGGGERPEAHHFAALLRKVRDRPDAHLIQTVMLRSLSQAVYSPDNLGHFGLALPAYVHFTSPIRRYPDLLVHRGIRHVLQNRRRRRKRPFLYTEADMDRLGAHCSMTERRADEATRDAVEWLKCEYMMDKVGETFPGIVSGVTSFGLFVQLREIYVEGLLHVTALANDYYHFDAASHRLVGERTRVRYQLGDPIEVQVARVDLDERKIDFVLPPDTGHAGPDRRPGTRRSTAGRRSRQGSRKRRRMR
ncbi:MAG: ribonuclease R [Gammaproteobacteria bacterium]|nr:MAG: ribonuclease R [Gammaproteobacteria bacterium]